MSGHRIDNGLIEAATVLAAVGSATVGGVFFAFSTFVMPALGRRPASEATAAMQSINVKAVNPLFMGALFGTGMACVGLAVAAVTVVDGPARVLLLVGSGAYLLGDIALTIAFHVPRNDALAALDPNGAGVADHWNRYLAGWTAGNHVRAVAALVAAVSLTVALRIG